MKEHSYSCEYPEGCSCGASEFNQLARTAIKMKGHLDEILGLYEPWNLHATLDKLCQAVEHLKTVHMCDGDGHEQYWKALEEGKRYIEVIENILKK